MKKFNLIKLILLAMSFIVIFAVESIAKGWVSDGFDNWQWVDENGIYETNTIKSSGNDKFYLDNNGYMVRDYLLEDYNDNVYYFDETGKMVMNTWVAVDPMQVTNQMDNAPTIYLYYFGSSGKAYKAGSGVVRKSIDGKKYLFNENGQMLSGWINEQGERFDEMNTEDDPFVGYCYYAGDETDGVLREGWSAYEDGSVEDRYYLKQTLWFYFSPGNNKKVLSDSSTVLQKKKINGKTYAFDDNGVMTQGWDSDMLDPNADNSSIDTKNYFSEDESEIGRMHKKEWVFAVPSKKQDSDDHDQEVQRWFYALGGGDIVKGVMRRINTHHYAFNDQGIMKKGLCIIDKSTKAFVDCIDAEKTDGKDFIISRHYISTDKYSAAKEYEYFDDSAQQIFYFMEDETDETFGRRQLGEVTVAFGDDDYTFKSKGSGELEGLKDKKYYQAGIKLMADKAIGLGLVFLGYSTSSTAAAIDEKPVYYDSTHAYAAYDVNHTSTTTGAYVKSDYIVLRSVASQVSKGYYPVFSIVDSSGNKVTKSYTAKKDKSNHYWLIGANATLVNVYEVPIRFRKSSDGSKWQFKSEKLVDSGKSTKITTTWIDFYDPTSTTADKDSIDVYGRTCCDFRTDKTKLNGYVIELDETYATNFRFTDG